MLWIHAWKIQNYRKHKNKNAKLLNTVAGQRVSKMEIVSLNVATGKKKKKKVKCCSWHTDQWWWGVLRMQFQTINFKNHYKKYFRAQGEAAAKVTFTHCYTPMLAPSTAEEQRCVSESVTDSTGLNVVWWDATFTASPKQIQFIQTHTGIQINWTLILQILQDSRSLRLCPSTIKLYSKYSLYSLSVTIPFAAVVTGAL